MNDTNNAPPVQAARVCAGGSTHYMGALTFRVTAPNGRIGYACADCHRRAQDDHVFRDSVVRCVATGGTLRETEAIFANAGLTMPTTPAGVRALLTGMSRDAARETGTGFDVDAVMQRLARGVE